MLEAGLSGAQLHGHETPKDADEVRRAAKVLFVAFPAGDPGLAHVEEYHPDAVLLDAPVPGSGHVFDWSLAVEDYIQAQAKLGVHGLCLPPNVS